MRALFLDKSGSRMTPPSGPLEDRFAAKLGIQGQTAVMCIEEKFPVDEEELVKDDL